MLLTRIQDEVHRFSITYQRARHKKEAYSLELTKVKGIGEKKAQKLLMKYKTKAAMKEASAEELAAAAGVSGDIAGQLYRVIQEL